MPGSGAQMLCRLSPCQPEGSVFMVLVNRERWCVPVPPANFSLRHLGRRRRTRPSLFGFVSAVWVRLTTLLSGRVCVCIGTPGLHTRADCWLDLQAGATPVASIGLGWRSLLGLSVPQTQLLWMGWRSPLGRNPPVPPSVTSGSSYSKQKNVLSK